MKIDITNLFNGSNEVIAIDRSIDLSNLQYGGYFPIQNGVSVKGSIYQNAGIVYFEAAVSFKFNGFCDRCVEDIERNYDFSIKRILVSSLAYGDDYDDYIVVENGELLLEELIGEEILFFLPSKMLCKDDCKGICPQCGKNLNLGKCGCKKEADPRMAALFDLKLPD